LQCSLSNLGLYLTCCPPAQVSPLPALEAITDQLLHMWVKGVTVTRSDGSQLTIRMKLLFPISDYPGLGSLFGPHMKQSPTIFADYKTWHGGERVPNYKTVYDCHWR